MVYTNKCNEQQENFEEVSILEKYNLEASLFLILIWSIIAHTHSQRYKNMVVLPYWLASNWLLVIYQT